MQEEVRQIISHTNYIVFLLFCFFYYPQYYLIDNILDNDENPIVRVPLSISGEGGGLVIVEHLDDNDGPDYDDDGNDWRPNRRRINVEQGMMMMLKFAVSMPKEAIMYK